MPKTEKTPHPKSRKAEQLVRKNVQKLRRTEHEIQRNKKTSVLQKHCFFYLEHVKQLEAKYKQDHPNFKTVTVARKKMSAEEIHEMIELFLQQRKQKVEEKFAKRRAKLALKLQVVVQERQDYEKGGGLKAPDLSDKDTYAKFVLWDGQANTLAGIKMKHFKSLNSVSTIWTEVDQQNKEVDQQQQQQQKKTADGDTIMN